MWAMHALPPWCCGGTSIHIQHVMRCLDPEPEARSKEKAIKFETVDGTCRSNPECSIFIAAAGVYRNIAYCQLC
jgi:hypothetical protein